MQNLLVFNFLSKTFKNSVSYIIFVTLVVLTLSLLLQDISHECKTVVHKVSLSTYTWIPITKFECLYNGSCVLMTLSQVATVIMQNRPDISKLKHAVGEARMSITNEDYGVGNILARL